MCSAASENKLQIDFAFSSSLITRLRNFLAAHNPSMNIHIANVSIERSLSFVFSSSQPACNSILILHEQI